MATETGLHHSYSKNWPRTDCLTSDSQHADQGLSISELINHGSVSFGRFSVESLAWEKWSVFSHNRYQEEVEKFKAPGLVAQKKAYFEEYYRKLRVMKKIQAEQQETNLPDPCQEEQSTITEAEISVDNITKAKEENKPNDSYQTEFSKTGTTEDSSNEFLSKQPSNNHNDSVSMGVEVSILSSTIEPVHFAKKAGSKPAPSIKKFSASAQHDILVSNTTNPNKPNDHAHLSKAKWTAALARKERKMECRTKKDVVRPEEKPNSSLDSDTTGKTCSHHLMKRTISKAAKNIQFHSVSSDKPFAEIQSRTTATRMQQSVLEDNPASSSCTVRVDISKRNLNSKSLPNKVPEAVTRMQHSVLKNKPASSSFTFRGDVSKGNLNSKGSPNKSTSKETSVPRAVRNMNLEKRTQTVVAGKSLELSNHHLMPKKGQSEIHKPKVMSRNLPAQRKSIQNFGVELGRRNDIRGKEKKVINTGPRGVPKQASAMLLGTNKASNLKVECKAVQKPSADVTIARRDQRGKMPSWR